MWHPCNYSGGGTKDSTMYDGRDLTKIFASEIANFPSPWHWIQDRINNGNFTGINDEDFIPLTFDNETHEMQININTYKGTTDQNLGNHIDFISRDCYSQPVQWNTTDNNNGTAAQNYPYLASNVKAFLDQLYNNLPEDVKQFIVSKRTILEKRYSASGALTDSTDWNWADLGKLWIPSEYEVFGSTIWGTKIWSVGQAVQYAIFTSRWKNRVKCAGLNGDRCDWWLLSIMGDSSASSCLISDGGNITSWPTTRVLHVPICFRFTEQQS